MRSFVGKSWQIFTNPKVGTAMTIAELQILVEQPRSMRGYDEQRDVIDGNDMELKFVEQ